MGTALSLKGKTVAVTGASGSLGRALIGTLADRGAQPVALTTSADAEFEPGVAVQVWQPGEEAALRERLATTDILVLNHGVNVGGDRDPAAIARSYEVNAWSGWRLMEAFLETAAGSEARALKEVWVNTSEAEVSPAFSPLYELSKRTMGDLVTLRRLDSPIVIRKLILGPFRSNLNPIGVMSPDWVARAIVTLARWGFRDIIVTVNPLTYLVFPPKEAVKSLYFRLFTRRDRQS